MNIRIAICDDEKAETAYLKSLVDRWAKNNNVVACVSIFESAESFLFSYADDKAFDILLLDIQMKEINGIELAKRIRAGTENGGFSNEALQIIFITGFPDFMAEGYDVSALHYLMKPICEEKLYTVLDKAYKNIKSNERTILLNIGSECARIPVSHIIYAEAFAHYVTITTTLEKYVVKQPIGNIEKMLGDGFVRCHRSYIVGLKYVKRITKTDLVLDDGTTIPLSRRAYNDVNQAFIKFYKGA